MTEKKLSNIDEKETEKGDLGLKQVEIQVDRKTMKRILRGMNKKKRPSKSSILLIASAIFIFVLVFAYIIKGSPSDFSHYKGDLSTSNSKNDTQGNSPKTASPEISLELAGILKTPVKTNFTYDANKNASIYTATGEKVVYLTFDDGPSANITPKILDILDKYNVSATFFVLGTMVNKNPEILKDTYNRGHIIANHGYSHKYKKIYSSIEAFANDVNEGYSAVSSTLGFEYPYKIYRFPGGGHSSSKNKFKEVLINGEYYYFDWNALTDDSVGNKEPANQVSKAIASSGDKNNVVILMHDSATMASTPSSLPDIIQHYIDSGYTFKTLADYTYN